MTATATMDSLTADALRQAVAAASGGRINEALDIARRALANGGEPGTLNAFLGALEIRDGELQAGIAHLRKARTARPADAMIAFNLASALTQQQDYLAALAEIPAELADSDPTMRLERLRGFLAQSLEHFDDAITSYERIVAAAPDDWETWNNLGNARRALDDGPGTLDALRRAVEINPGSAPLRFNLATALVWAGEADEAEKALQEMAADFPEDWRPLRELHALLKSQWREDDATAPLEEAVRRDPANIELNLGLAAHLVSREQHEAGERTYRSVLQIEPDNTLAFLGIATVLDLNNRTEELTALVGEAEQANVHADGLRFVRAYDHRRAKRYAEGLEELLSVPDELETARRQNLLGQLLEGVGDYDGAFAAFERMNAISRAEPSQPEERGATYREIVRRERETVTPEWVDSWRDVPEDERPGPAFLVGFPRSGTTLLDTFLMSHPGTEVLEEEPALLRATEALGGFDAIAGASAQQLRAARDAYFNTARSLTPLAPGKLLIDKNPLAMNSVPMIRRLFPDSKIILAVRHPCDVVLSCFVTNFKPNNGMVSFLRLETAAELYDLSFSFFERSSAVLRPQVHTVTYENIVADRGKELRPLFEFLDLPWNDSVLDHQSTAKKRGHIKTASYAQVVEPIYTRSSGRWRNYRRHLEPVLPVLKPWADKFGYEI